MGRSGPAGSVSAAYVELRLAGTFRVVRDGTELTDGEIGSRKSRTLLKLLTIERPGLVPVDRIVDVLWPNERPAAPEQNVATLVSRLRAVLGADVIQGGRAGYRLAAGPGIVVDLDAAARFCDQAEGKLATAAAVALAAAERAHELLSAGTAVGDEPYADWADPARERVRELLRRVRLAAAEAALATGDPRLAAGYAEAAMAADPLDEAAHRWYMSASVAAGEQAKALAAYEALRQRLGHDLGADPSAQTRELHIAILREQAGGPAAGAGHRRPTPGPGKPGGTALAGREGEIESLREAWSTAVGGQPGLVTIVGEAGIGKTALAEFLAAEAAEDGGTVLRTRCYETERSLFLQPIIEAIAPVAASTSAGALRQMLGEHAAAAAGLLPEVAAILGPPPPGRGSMEMERRRAFEAVRAFLRGLAERNPAAVLGTAVDPLTLGVMLDLVRSTAVKLCEAALEARLLMVSGRNYEFANDLIREVLYASTPEPTRLAHHRQAADLLTGQPESLARHAAAAGDWLRAARAWLRPARTPWAGSRRATRPGWPPRRWKRAITWATRRCPPARWSCEAAHSRPWAPTTPRSPT